MDVIFVNNVKKILLERKIANLEFANTLGKSEVTLCRILNLSRPVRLFEAYDIANALEVSLDELCNVNNG